MNSVQAAVAIPATDAPSSDVPIQSAAFGLLPAPGRWHDPLGLMQETPPENPYRVVLGSVIVLCAAVLIWAFFGRLDIVSSAEGKLVPQTLVKIVQPAEAGVVRELRVREGDLVLKGQILAVLDATMAGADTNLANRELALQRLQLRRMEAELAGNEMRQEAGDAATTYAVVQSQFQAHRRAYNDAVDQEQALLVRYEHEYKSGLQVLAKLEQTVPIYQRSAEAYQKLQGQGFVSAMAYDEKIRDYTEKQRDFDAQRATVASLAATIASQQKKLKQMRSAFESDLRKELADVTTRVQQLEADKEKSAYRESLLTLRAPQDGEIKDIATTTLGAVVQPGTVLMTLVPKDELLYADVSVKNEDVGFVRVGDEAKVKVATYPFQKYGMLEGAVVHVSVDATENEARANAQEPTWADGSAGATYKARVRLKTQRLVDAFGTSYSLGAGMRIVAEIRYGDRTVMEYLLAPVKGAMHDAARER
ncbi:HlyD family type I secretion periplasmic adaptor subunit [Cupriavidus pampae]|uniref:Membrane fusion protein (MFP) family protein n=1 Tax=Cupriavidus pampae TaxID=659251 RepID=A0ABN7Y3B6_9BURK|nr:HlyD family type I secretion periplasmic adaptor subunit [Cupriavidus pampae]CAG9166440.1 Leukotoxin export protein LtxD [Cupriavidus pampae]